MYAFYYKSTIQCKKVLFQYNFIISILQHWHPSYWWLSFSSFLSFLPFFFFFFLVAATSLKLLVFVFFSSSFLFCVFSCVILKVFSMCLTSTPYYCCCYSCREIMTIQLDCVQIILSLANASSSACVFCFFFFLLFCFCCNCLVTFDGKSFEIFFLCDQHPNVFMHKFTHTHAHTFCVHAFNILCKVRLCLQLLLLTTQQ